ncbi:MAG: hypothetical protein H7Y89_04475, partial [Steroidobacteraceae bacterium]|nr:hypothetical protein [Steroidobacteraceae bacterium]
MSRAFTFALLATVLLIAIAILGFAAPAPPQVSVERNVVYGMVSGAALL